MANEKVETMADYEDQINASMKKFKEGDRVRGTIISVEEDEVLIDLHTFSQGIIYPYEYSDDPSFHVMDELRTGDDIDLIVIDIDDGRGYVVLSLKDAMKESAWERLSDAIEQKKIYSVKVLTSVNGGVIAYLDGIRGFIPASQLDIDYVEDVDEYVGEKLDVVVITAEPDKEKLVLSVKEVKKEIAAKEHDKKLSALQKGFITEGEINRIEPYGCFVDIGDGLVGLVHISEIANRFLKSPKEVVKYGDRVRVKVLSVEDGKIRLSMKQAEDSEAPDVEDEKPESFEYHDEDDGGRTLAGLFAGIKIE